MDFNKIISGCFLVLCFITLVGCEDQCIGGSDVCGDVHTSNTSIKKETDRASVALVNSTDESLIYYHTTSNNKDERYKSSNQLGSVLRFSSDKAKELSWTESVKHTFSTTDANTKTKNSSITTELNKNQRYWLVSWMDDKEYKIDIVLKERLNITGKYSVRVFSDKDVEIYNGKSLLAKIKKGSLSDYITAENCDDLKFGKHPITLCEKTTAGESYIVIINSNGTAIIERE